MTLFYCPQSTAKIGSISKQTGESVQPGETIATISSSQVEKIVGYVPATHLSRAQGGTGG